MIIDIHAHMGVVPNGYQMPLENQSLDLQNKDIVKGLKVHPDIYELPFCDKKMHLYLEMAEHCGLSVLVHTKETDYYLNLSLSKEAMNKIMFQNAKRLFRL